MQEVQEVQGGQGVQEVRVQEVLLHPLPLLHLLHLTRQSLRMTTKRCCPALRTSSCAFAPLGTAFRARVAS